MLVRQKICVIKQQHFCLYIDNFSKKLTTIFFKISVYVSRKKNTDIHSKKKRTTGFYFLLSYQTIHHILRLTTIQC